MKILKVIMCVGLFLVTGCEGKYSPDSVSYERAFQAGQESAKQTKFSCKTMASGKYDHPTSQEIDNYRRTWGTSFSAGSLLSESGPTLDITITTNDSALVSDLIKVCAGARAEVKQP